MKISGVVEKYVRLVTDMYESVVRCAFGVKDWFKMEVGIASGICSEPPPPRFMILMERLTYGVKQESSWSMINASFPRCNKIRPRSQVSQNN